MKLQLTNDEGVVQNTWEFDDSLTVQDVHEFIADNDSISGCSGCMTLTFDGVNDDGDCPACARANEVARQERQHQPGDADAPRWYRLKANAVSSVHQNEAVWLDARTGYFVVCTNVRYAEECKDQVPDWTKVYPG